MEKKYYKNSAYIPSSLPTVPLVPIYLACLLTTA